MILVTGSLAFDHIMDFPGKFADHIMPDKVHMLNVSFLVTQMRKSFGGTAGNISYTLSLLGIRTVILGIAGEDFATYREFLEKNEIDTSYIKSVNNLYTSTAFGVTDSRDNHIWGFYSGADSLSDHLSIHDIEGKIDFGIVAPNNPRAMIKFAREYQQLKIPYLFDAGMQLPWLSGADLHTGFNGAKIIIGNDYEISVMEKKMEIADLHSLSSEDKIVITTLGEQGSRISADGKTIQVKAARVRNVSDPAGAGDVYRAGFMAGFMRNLPLKTCAQMGSVAAAYTVEKFGTTTHSFTIPDFERRYKENFGEEIKL
ncbi:carbohydrate kinase family protein [Candidatus Gottesmanbacteria bacterium]|nr:carbohydrate kinase family protein [Candidatus Gottesmanbacteria bacterium]